MESERKSWQEFCKNIVDLLQSSEDYATIHKCFFAGACAITKVSIQWRLTSQKALQNSVGTGAVVRE
jgi:hypothetical protein